MGFALTMPDIILDVLVEAVDISTVIEVDIGDLTEIKPNVKDVVTLEEISWFRSPKRRPIRYKKIFVSTCK